MASIRREISVAAEPAEVWDAVRDYGALHVRLVAGFVTSSKLEGDTRTIAFANGATAKERLVDIDDANRRLAYSAASPQIEHHNASVTISANGAGGTQIVWVTDVLPNALSAYIAGMMEEGARAMKRTLERAAKEGQPLSGGSK